KSHHLFAPICLSLVNFSDKLVGTEHACAGERVIECWLGKYGKPCVESSGDIERLALLPVPGDRFRNGRPAEIAQIRPQRLAGCALARILDGLCRPKSGR